MSHALFYLPLVPSIHTRPIHLRSVLRHLCLFRRLAEQCAKDCTYTYDTSLTKCNQQVSDVTKNTYGANLDACANIASGVMDDCMVSYVHVDWWICPDGRLLGLSRAIGHVGGAI